MRDGSTHLPVRPGKLRVLLACLLLSANRPVPHEAVDEWLWGDRLPHNPRGSLATYVMRLRHALGADESVLRTCPAGYLLRVAPEQLDVSRFTELVAASRRADSPEDELRLLTESLAQWRGAALADVASDALRHGFAVALEEQRLQVVERRAEVALALGRHAELVAELTSHVVEHPLRERLRMHLMLALYRSGRQAAAIDAYSRLRTLLIDELGLEPTEQVRRLHHQMLAGDPALDPPSDRTIEIDPRPRPAPRWEALSHLLPDTEDFVGRGAVIETIAGRLGSAGTTTAVPIVVISGAPGMGKTTLAVRVAHRLRARFPDGQLFSRLGGAQPSPRDPGDVLADLLNASGISPSTLPDGVDRRSAAFRARLTDRRVLLVLDDAADAEHVLPLLPGTPGCAVLITTRQLISELPGATVVRLPAFASDEAITFLTHMLGPERVAHEPESVSALARQCADVPLALRIVGARLALRPTARIAGLADRLADDRHRLDELRIGNLSVRAGLAASYDALTPEAAAAFRRLGLLPRTSVAAWAIGILAESTNDAVVTEQLLQANLISEAGVDLTDEPRYRLHDLVADYASELAGPIDAVENGPALQQYVRALLVLADAAYSTLDAIPDAPPPDPLDPAAATLDDRLARLGRWGSPWLVAEQDALIWAIDTCCTLGWYDRAAQLAERSLEYLDNRLPHQQVLAIHARIRDTARRAGDERIAWRAELIRAAQDVQQGPTAQVTDALAACVRAFTRLGAELELVAALVQLTWTHRVAGAHAEALATAARAVDIAERGGHPLARLCGIRELATAIAVDGRPADALRLLEDALGTARQLGSRAMEAHLLDRIAGTAIQAGDLDRAGTAADQLLRAVARLDDERAPGYAATRAAEVAVARGDGVSAIRYAERALQDFDAIHDVYGTALATVGLAEALIAAGQRPEAMRIAREALKSYDDLGAQRLLARLQAVLDSNGGTAGHGSGAVATPSHR